MKIAAFNVENLFDRARAFNLPNRADTRAILAATAELNGLFEQDVYDDDDVRRIGELMIELGLERSDRGPQVLLRQIRGRVVRRARDEPLRVIARRRDDWVGWVELRTGAVNAVAIMNTGRVIRDVDADILAVVEAEDRVALEQFSTEVLAEVGGLPYAHVMVIDGNDERGIDVGLMTRGDYELGTMRSHIHDTDHDGDTIFSRDCPEYQVIMPDGTPLWVLPNHFKSKFGGNDRASRERREAQASRTAEIYRRLVAEGHQHVVVLGDLNDVPDSAELAPLLEGTDLTDVSDHHSFDPGEFTGRPGTDDRGIGTYGLGNDNQKIDYLLLSPALFDRVTASGLFRMGAWPGTRPRRWTVYPELLREVHVASDHHVIWAEIADLT